MSYNSLFRYAVSTGILVLILAKIDFSLLSKEAAQFNWPLMALATLAMVAQIFFLSLRWHVLLNAGRKKLKFRTSLLINIAGYFANVLFITSVGGIIAKSGLAIRYGVSVAHSIFATFMDRFMSLAALVAFTAISLPVLSGILDVQVTVMLSSSVALVIFISALFVWGLRSGRMRDLILSNRKMSRMTASLRSLTGNKKLLRETAFRSLIAQACFIAGVTILSSGFSYDGDLIEFIALIPVLALIASLPISFGGWGVREGAFIYGLGLIGFSMESAFILSVQVGLVTLIAPFIVGLPYMISKKFEFPLPTLKNIS